MSTLSVQTYTVAGGRTNSLTCGPAFNCPDPRDEFYPHNIDGKTMESLSFSSDGCRYYLYKINGGRGNASEACVFIPQNISTAQSPIMQIVSLLKTLVDSGNTTESMKAEIKRLCTIQCPEMRNIVPSRGSQTAAVYYGDSVGLPLTEILYDVFRPEFNGYLTIFLSDSPEVRYHANEIQRSVLYHRDLIVVRHPSPDPRGFVPTIEGTPFVRDQYMFYGTPFVVEWSKKYWHTIRMNLYASNALSPMDYVPEKKAYKRTRNNPLYTGLIVIAAIIVVAVSGLIVAKTMKANKIKQEQETRLQSKIDHLEFDIHFSDYSDIDNKAEWEDAFQRAKSLKDTYQYKVHKPQGVFTPEDINAFCNVVEAAAYLDQHTEWVKDEMENLDSLKGFFDFVNSYDIVLAKKKGLEFIQRFKGVSNVENLLALNPQAGLSGKCSSSGRLILSVYKEKVEGCPIVDAQAIIPQKTSKEQPKEVEEKKPQTQSRPKLD